MKNRIWTLAISMVALCALAQTAPAMIMGNSSSASFNTDTDTIPNFALNPTVKSAQNGNWSSASTWNTGRVPSTSDIVLISHTVTYDSNTGNVNTIGVNKGGVLSFKTDQSTKLQTANILVLPEGTFRIGTKANPLPANFTAEIVIKNNALDTVDDGVGTYDPFQWGTGFLSLDGTVEIYGAPKSPTFVRLAKEPLTGVSTLELSLVPSGWKAGDRIILPDTDYRPKTETPWGEELVIRAIAQTTVTLETPLKRNHLGARDADGTLRFLPHVANLSRNVIFRSENPDGTRGHTAFLHRSSIDIEYALFRDLGRTKGIDVLNSTVLANPSKPRFTAQIGTNQIGRYALHAHHLFGPLGLPANEPQFRFIGNAVDGSPKIGIAIHRSHYGLIQYNVVYKALGSGFMIEDASESYNTIADNFAMASFGTNGPIYSRQTKDDFGFEGSGFWLRGSSNNYMRNNVATGASRDGFVFGSLDVGKLAFPTFKGANTNVAGESRVVDGNYSPTLEFTGNEAYGPLQIALNIWQVGTGIDEDGSNKATGIIKPQESAESVYRDFKAWLIGSDGVSPRGNQITLENLVIRGNGTTKGGDKGIAVKPGRISRNVTVKNPDIQGMMIGIHVPTRPNYPTNYGGNTPVQPWLIEGGILSNNVNIQLDTLSWIPTGAYSDPNFFHPRTTVIRNVRFQAYKSKPLTNINLVFSPPPSSGSKTFNIVQKDEIIVENYNGDPNKDFKVYYPQQAPAFIVPRSVPNYVGSPASGLTNTQLFAQYGQAVAGAMALCSNNQSYPEIKGYTCP